MESSTIGASVSYLGNAVDRLMGVNSRLDEIYSRLRRTADRAFGPIPEAQPADNPECPGSECDRMNIALENYRIIVDLIDEQLGRLEQLV